MTLSACGAGHRVERKEWRVRADRGNKLTSCDCSLFVAHRLRFSPDLPVSSYHAVVSLLLSGFVYHAFARVWDPVAVFLPLSDMPVSFGSSFSPPVPVLLFSPPPASPNPDQADSVVSGPKGAPSSDDHEGFRFSSHGLDGVALDESGRGVLPVHGSTRTNSKAKLTRTSRKPLDTDPPKTVVIRCMQQKND